MPDATTEEVATTSLAMALGLVRHVPFLDRHARDGGWDCFATGPRRRPSSLTLGIVGMGRTGRALARLAAPVFGRVVATDPAPADVWPAGVERLLLDDLLTASDVLALHAPAVRGAPPLLDAAALAPLADSARSWSIAHAGRCSTSTRCWRRSTTDGWAAPRSTSCRRSRRAADAAVLRHPRVVVTPHAAFWSREGELDAERKQAANVTAWRRDGRPLTSGPGGPPMTTTTTTCGAALAGLLEERGVDVVFGIPGVHTLEIYRGLAASGIRHVVPRHEQGAGFMADGYGRVADRPGVCVVISGPGVTNVLTPLGQARHDARGLLVLSGSVRRSARGRRLGVIHDLPDQLAVTRPIARYATTVETPEDLEPALAAAWAAMEGADGLPGPAHVAIPLDVLGEPAAAAARSAPAAAPREPAAADVAAGGRAAGRRGPPGDRARRRRAPCRRRGVPVGRSPRRAAWPHHQREGRRRPAASAGAWRRA